MSALVLAAGLSPAAAEVEIADGLTIGGRLKQGIALAYDNKVTGGGVEIGQAAYLIELTSAWRPAANVTVTGDFWLRGDLYREFGGELTGRGIQDYSSPDFRDQFRYRLDGRGAGTAAGPLADPPRMPFGSEDEQNVFLSDFNDEMIRELAVKVTDPENRYALKIGKFVRAWGQSDGLRLLDVLHAQDYRQKFIFGDSDEMRIPSWMTAVDLDLGRLGLGDAFEAIGLDKPRLELIYMPEYHHSRFVINNPTPGDATSGGLYGLPYPLLADKASGRGVPFFGASLSDNEPDRFSLSEPTLGGRLKFDVLGGEGTLNALYGYQDMPIVKLTGAQAIIGNALHDGGNAVMVAPLDLATTEAVVQGLYVPTLRAGGTAQDIQTNVLGCPYPGGSFCSVNVQFDLDYRFRRKLVGGSFSRDMAEWQLGPKGVSPVLRTEFAYEFDKPFNRAVATTVLGTREEGTAALIVDPARGVAERDQMSFMIGADYFLWLPFWETQDTSIFTSVQFFTILTPNGEDLLFQAPYAAYGAKLHKVQNYGTLLASHNFDDGRLGAEVLVVYDLQNDGFAVRQRLDFNYFGDHWRPRIELTHFEASPEQGVLGIANQSDNIEFSLTAQF
ncbi:hypothetical protein DKG75_22225 [Zavarzinia compransoris]|uniref:DUF1302 domain-containing protein n=1 Tax=Zavarzinia compransoris TaxID=1264899 RepID=A0A317DT46_9PROT|nr:hypothetical protein DKG75_22225 [Zavarzinia compransoris]